MKPQRSATRSPLQTIEAICQAVSDKTGTRLQASRTKSVWFGMVELELRRYSGRRSSSRRSFSGKGATRTEFIMTIERNRFQLLLLVVFLSTSTSMRPSEWNSPPVAVLAVVSGSAGVT